MAQELTHAGVDLITTYGIHEGSDPDEWDKPFIIGQFPGVRGETHLKDEHKGRDIRVVVRYRNFETSALLESAMDELLSYRGNDGQLEIDNEVFENCTFVSLRRLEKKFRDGSGVYGWTVKTLLTFRQREPNAEPEPEP